MSSADVNSLSAEPSRDVQEWLARTPARLLQGRAGASYRASTWLELREDHAFAIDAVHDEWNAERDLGPDFHDRFDGFEIATLARTKSEYLLRPDLGRKLDPDGVAVLKARRPQGADLQIAIGDGLSVAAIRAQVPRLLPSLIAEAESRGWSVGLPFAIRHCRVGVLNDIGEALRPRVVVLLIGERPGLATSESLSAYLAHRPQAGHSDAQRNLISNIHDRGVPVPDAVRRILGLAEEMRRLETSGIEVKEPPNPSPGCDVCVPPSFGTPSRDTP